MHDCAEVSEKPEFKVGILMTVESDLQSRSHAGSI
jgi:hypothetical protein